MTIKRMLAPKEIKDYYDIFRFLLDYHMVLTREEAIDTLNEFLYRYQSDGLIDEIQEAVQPLVMAYKPALEAVPEINDQGQDTSIPNLMEMEYLGE